MSVELVGPAKPRTLFQAYRPGQGKMSRTLILWTGFLLLAWGCRSLMLALPEFFPRMGQGLNEFQAFGGALPQEAWSVDLVFFATKVSSALAIAVVVLLAGSLWWWRFMNRPKWADLVIEMEQELKKVSWPTFGDAWQSTLVVTAFTVALVAMTFLFDIVIGSVIELIAKG